MHCRITTETGNQYLVHKGPGYGGSGGNTVVTDARYMSDKWTVSLVYNSHHILCLIIVKRNIYS